MSENIVKVTFHKRNSQPFHVYLKNVSPNLVVLQQEVKISLFQLHDQDFAELRFYWIDDDSDEVDLTVQNDYDVFLLKRRQSMHIHVAPIPTLDETTTINTEAQASNTEQNEQPQTVHNSVECDSCLMAPIVGFRYKCLQCPNYDLCGQCESKHKHSEHMMIRLSTPTFAKIDIAGTMCARGFGRHRRRNCPFIPVATPAGEDASSAPQANENGRERHHHRRKTREIRSNFFSNLYNIMHDLAEGGVQDSQEEEVKSPEKVEKQTANGQEKDSKTTETGTNTTANPTNETNNTQPLSCEQQKLPSFPQMNEKEDAIKYSERIKEYTSLMGKSIEDMRKATDVVKAAAEIAKAKSMESTNMQNDETTTSSQTPDVIEMASDTAQISFDEIIDTLPAPIMKTGIEILQNVSQIFSRLIDQDASSSSSTNTARKLSNVSQSSSATQTSERAPDVTNSATSPVVADQSSSQEGITKESSIGRDSNEENDWQIIDENSASANSPKDSAHDADNVRQKEITFSDLLKQLKTEEQAQKDDLSAEVASGGIETVSTNPQQSTVGSTSADPEVSTTSSSNGAVPNISTERRSNVTYHPNAMINDSINAMIAMGFSNEGACLTQLLESVNGNISEALDIMSLVQNVK